MFHDNIFFYNTNQYNKGSELRAKYLAGTQLKTSKNLKKIKDTKPHCFWNLAKQS